MFFLCILINLYIFFLNVIYMLFKLFPVKKNQILFLSRQTNKPSIDFRMIANELAQNYPEYKIKIITKRVEKNLKDFVSKNMFSIVFQMYYLATSKICIIDGYNMSVSVLKHKKDLKIIQLWHSLGALKKFGYQVLYKKTNKMFAKAMRMHKNYDLILSSSKQTTSYFSKAFNYPQDKFLDYGLPRIDYILNKTKINKEKIYNKYPELRNKKIILYAPTFRRSSHEYKIKSLIDSINSDEYVLIVKLHPCINYKSSINKIYTCDEFSSLQLLSVADFVITDYSAISIEAAILNKPIFIYAYDLDDYKNYPGLNVDLYNEFGKYVFRNAKKLFQVLSQEKYDIKIVKKYKKKYVVNVKKTCTSKIVNKIVEMSGYSVKTNESEYFKYS